MFSIFYWEGHLRIIWYYDRIKECYTITLDHLNSTHNLIFFPVTVLNDNNPYYCRKDFFTCFKEQKPEMCSKRCPTDSFGISCGSIYHFLSYMNEKNADRMTDTLFFYWPVELKVGVINIKNNNRPIEVSLTNNVCWPMIFCLGRWLCVVMLDKIDQQDLKKNLFTKQLFYVETQRKALKRSLS